MDFDHEVMKIWRCRIKPGGRACALARMNWEPKLCIKMFSKVFNNVQMPHVNNLLIKISNRCLPKSLDTFQIENLIRLALCRLSVMRLSGYMRNMWIYAQYLGICAICAMVCIRWILVTVVRISPPCPDILQNAQNWRIIKWLWILVFFLFTSCSISLLGSQEKP